MGLYNIYGGHALRIAIGKVFGILALIIVMAAYIGEVGAATEINSCTTINSPGEYVVKRDMNNTIIPGETYWGNCIRISSSDVILDGEGHIIYNVGLPIYEDMRDTAGVFVNNTNTSLSNVTVKNIKVDSWGAGIYYGNIRNGRIINTNVSNSFYGILLSFSNNSELISNYVFKNRNGIYIESSNNNMISMNKASNNKWLYWWYWRSYYIGYGISLISSSENTIYNNNISYNHDNGFYLDYGSKGNIIYRNNIMNNSPQALSNSIENFWDSGYPDGGNYWSDYNGIDSNGDGIGDTPYNISGDAGAKDRYPFMKENGWMTPIPPVPELSTMVLMSVGLLGLFGVARMRRKD